MRKTLEEKLNAEYPTYAQAEIDWLLENIGHESPEIRDDLVFVTLARSIHLGFFSKAQFQYLAEQSQGRDLQLFQLENGFPAVLTRTFAALLNSNLIWADGASESPYFQALTDGQRDYFFESGLTYLTKEQFFTGYSEQYGWIHGFAHGADVLVSAMQHPDFSENQAQHALTVLEQVFHRLPEPFIYGEERRLGNVVVTGILSEKLSQKQVADWLNQAKFSQNDNLEYTRLSNFEVFLAYIYFHLLEKIKFEDDFKAAILRFLREI